MPILCPSKARESPLPVQPRAMQPRAMQPCVLLRNDNVVFGAARQQGEQVLVERGDGTQIRIDRKQVLCWSDSLLNLYRYRLDHRVGTNVQVHLGEARWCLRYGLLEQASDEVEQLRRLDPTNPQAELLHRQIVGAYCNLAKDSHQATETENSHPSFHFASDVTIDEAPVSQVDEEQAALSIDPSELHDFVSQVQPILLNRCGSCHSHTTDREWKLITPARGVRTSSRMTRENYAATVPYIDVSAPSASSLLRYAITAHGGGAIPLGPRNAVAAEALKRWSQSVADHHADASKLTRASVPSSSMDPILKSAAIQDANESEFPAADPDATALKPRVEGNGLEPQLQRLPPVDNPFDPELFNRRFHRDPPLAQP